MRAGVNHQVTDIAVAAVDPSLTSVPLWLNMEEGSAGIGAHVLHLTSPEVAALAVLVAFAGRVVSREVLARRCGLRDRGQRRVDSLLVGIRKALGPDAITTVRSRGWILNLDKIVVPGDGPAPQRAVPFHRPPAAGPPGGGGAWT
jgi:DNA-binding response OmpR family regulator